MAADESQAELRQALRRIKNLERELELTSKENERLRKRNGSAARNQLDEQDILSSYASEEGAKDMLMSQPTDKRRMMATKVGQQRWSRMTWLQRLMCVQNGRVTPPPPAHYVAFVPESATVVRVKCRHAGFSLLQGEEGQQTVVVSRYTDGTVKNKSYPVTSVHAPPVPAPAVQPPPIVPGQRTTWISYEQFGKMVMFPFGKIPFDVVESTKHIIDSFGNDQSFHILTTKNERGHNLIVKLKDENKTWNFRSEIVSLWHLSWTAKARYLQETKNRIYNGVGEVYVHARSIEMARAIAQDTSDDCAFSEENEIDPKGEFWKNPELSDIVKVCETDASEEALLTKDKFGDW